MWVFCDYSTHNYVNRLFLELRTVLIFYCGLFDSDGLQVVTSLCIVRLSVNYHKATSTSPFADRALAPLSFRVLQHQQAFPVPAESELHE